MNIQPVFCSTDPYKTVEWETRTAEIKQGDAVVFRQEGVRVPKSWSQMATNIVANKYFYGAPDNRESSVETLIHRVCSTIANWGVQDGYFGQENGRVFCDQLAWLCLHQWVSFNSPVWFNVGLYETRGLQAEPNNWVWNPRTNRVKQCDNPFENPQCSACFIQGVKDNMQDIMRLAASEAMLFKYGSGTGTDLSTLRSCRETLSGGGKPSGPLSFMRVYDQVAEVVRSGGVTRRAAKMQSLKDWHPDIKEFITCKREQEHHAQAIMEKGLTAEEAYAALLYQNANLSVRLSDDFMIAVEKDLDWTTHWVTDPTKTGPTYKARALFRLLAECTWECGDPGVQFDTTVNKWHTCPNSSRINASNPCGEYNFIDDSACNLASINLLKCRDEQGNFDFEAFGHVVRLLIIAMDIIVDKASYPTKQICLTSHNFRPLGLGYTNFGALLMSEGLPYDSDEGRLLCSKITSALHANALLTSAELANELGPFEAYEDNANDYRAVIDSHVTASALLNPNDMELRDLWNKVTDAQEVRGLRNAQVTVLAPTGTISFMMDCTTTGIEPELSLVKYKQLVGGGTLKMVNDTLPEALRNLGYSNINEIVQYVTDHGSVVGSPIREEHLPIFACSIGDNPIPWQAHIRMLSAAQPFISGAISKTINMPNDATVEQIEEAFKLGWTLGLKSVTIYRDGSKGHQPLTTKEKGTKEKSTAINVVRRRERMPDTRDSVTHKFSINGSEGYFTVGLYPDGRPGELFISIAKEGSTVGGLLGCFGVSISMALQYGVPLQVLVDKFTNMRFEPQGFTTNPEIRIAHSIVDYIFRWLAKRFQSEVAVPVIENKGGESSLDAPICDNCGSLCVRVGSCYLCYACGTSGGCS